MTPAALGPAIGAGVLAASAFLLLLRPAAPPWRRTAVGFVRRAGSGWALARGVRRPARPARALGLAGAITCWACLVGARLPPLPAAAAVALAATGVVRLHASRRRAAAERMAAAVAEAVGVLAADVSVGRSPPQALAALADEAARDPGADATWAQLGRLLRPVAETARLGGSVPEALRAVSRVDGCAALARVASAWQLAESSGAPVVPVLGRVASGVRLHADHLRDVRAELAGPRASARLLAALPVLGLLMGTGLGARPLHVLLATPYGQVALCAGVVLELAGLAWTDRIARAAEHE